jgi:hypothetical protein
MELKVFIKIFGQKYFGLKCLMIENHFLGNRLELKIFIKNFLVEKFFMVAKSFPG